MNGAAITLSGGIRVHSQKKLVIRTLDIQVARVVPSPVSALSMMTILGHLDICSSNVNFCLTWLMGLYVFMYVRIDM
jgi:hypothetical protein